MQGYKSLVTPAPWASWENKRASKLQFLNVTTHPPQLSHLSQIVLRPPNTTYWLTDLQVSAQSEPALKLPLSIHSGQCEDFVEFLDMQWCSTRAQSPLARTTLDSNRVSIRPCPSKQMPLIPGHLECLTVKSLALQCEQCRLPHFTLGKVKVCIQVPKGRANLVVYIFQHLQSLGHKTLRVRKFPHLLYPS